MLRRHDVVLTGSLSPGKDGDRLTDPTVVRRLYTRFRAQTLTGLTLVYAFFYTTRSVLDVVKKPLINAGIYDTDELGTIGACLLGAYAVGKLVNGFIADRVMASRFLAIGLLVSALANVAMGMNTGFYMACALWTVNGYFQGVGAAASVKSLTHWFSGRERGRVYGIWSAAHSLGEGATLTATAGLVVLLGWRAGFLAPGFACILVAAAALFVLKDRPQVYGLPEVHDWKGEPHTDTIASTRAAQFDVLKNPAIWVCAVSSALMYVTRYGVKSWGVLYLQDERGFSLLGAGGFLFVNTVSGFFGSIAYGFVSDVLFKGRRPPATLLFGALEVAALFVLFYGPHNDWILMGAIFVYGFTLSGILAVLGGLFAVDMSSKKAAGMAMGFIGFISYLGAVIQEKLSGALLKAHTVLLPDGTKHIDDFSQPIALWIGGSIASMLLAATLWRVKARE